MNKGNFCLPQNRNESWDIYQTLCNTESMYDKSFRLESNSIGECLELAQAVLFTSEFILVTGSTAEGTHITSEDYGTRLQSTSARYISDMDSMNVLCHVRVIDEGVTLPRRFGKYIYCRAERGKHTTDGFRKLRIIYSPRNYINQHKAVHWPLDIHMSIEHGYLSSLKFLASLLRHSTTNACTQGPSQEIQIHVDKYDYDDDHDLVTCFYVKTWPKEAESWLTRQSPWPDRKLKAKLKKIGYLLVATGNRNSQESDLEWRCSFSIAEKILFQSMTTFQRCTFVMLKVLLKEYLPSDINSDGEKQLLSTYHMKTLFLWCLEDSKLVWEPEHMLDIIRYMLDKLLQWINKQYFPHYFIASLNLLDGRRLHGKENSLISFISTIRNDLSNKINQSQFLMGQKINKVFVSDGMLDGRLYVHNHYRVMTYITGRLQLIMHTEVHTNMRNLREQNLRHSLFIDGLISIKPDVDPHAQHLYRAMYSDPIHEKLLKEVVPGLMNQYRGCIHLAKYCMAARDGRVLPGILHSALSLLKATQNLDPCAGHVKLACLYIIIRDFVKALERLQIAENNFLYMHKRMKKSALRTSEVLVNKLSTEISTFIINEVFQKWAEGQVTSDIVVTWPEYNVVTDLLQFELIHEVTQKFIGIHYTGLHLIDCRLQWPPLSMIKLLKFVCALNLGQSPASHMNNLVADLSLSFTVCANINDIYTVFNMAAWCYLKIKKYKPAAHMMTVAIGTSSQTEVMERCAFSHLFVAYVIGQCLQ